MVDETVFFPANLPKLTGVGSESLSSPALVNVVVVFSFF